MKYQLTELIKSLSKEEVRNFKVYSSRFKSQEDSKKLSQIFDILRKGLIDEYDDAIIDSLPEEVSKNAYYQLKNRLVKDIEDSLLILHKNKGTDFAIMRQLQLARIFLDKGEYHRSRNCLQKAEKTALKTDQKIFQCVIYNQWLDLESNMPDRNLSEIADKASDLIDYMGAELKGKLLVASIKDELFKSNNSHKSSMPVAATLEDIVENLKMSEEYANSTLLRTQVSDSVKHVLVIRRKYKELAEFIEIELEFLRKDSSKPRENREQEVKYLSWLINAYLRIKKIDAVNNNIIALEQLLSSQENTQLAKKHEWLLFQCRLVGMVYSGDIAKAINLLKEFEGEEDKVPHYFLLVVLNLSLLYFYNNQLDESLGCLAEIVMGDAFKKMGVPLQIIVSIIELVIRIEKEDYFYAQNRHKSIKRKYRNFLAKEEYQRDKVFLNILKDIISGHLNPNPLKKLKSKIKEFIQNSPPFEPGSNEALCYQLWLQAYLDKKDYYQLVLENINSKN